MKKQFLTAFLFLAPLFVMSAELACTKQQAVTAANVGVQVTLDLCKEAPELLPPGTASNIVALACQALEANAPAVTVLIDNVILNTMKAQYVREHGALPKGYAKLDGG